MKLGLISPKGTFFSKSRDFSREMINFDLFFDSSISNGLLIVAALTPDTFEVKLVDEGIEPVDFDESFDLVGISAMTQQSLRAYEIADRFRQKGTYVVLGGTHATLLPLEAGSHCDTVIVGEGEPLWPVFIRDFLNGRPAPVYREDQPGTYSLRDSPLPRYDLLRADRYKMIWIPAARGCRRDCEFCAASKLFSSRYRHKSVEQIVEEVRSVKRLNPRALIAVDDDNLSMDKRFARSLADALIPLRIRWMCTADVSIADDEDLLNSLFESGCSMVYIGFESVSEKSLASVDRGSWKARQVRKYPDAIRRIQSHGIGVWGSFVVGFDDDDVSIFRDIEDFVIENNLYAVYVGILTPFPGTRLRERLEKEGRLRERDWSHYTLSDVTFVPKRMTCEELEEGHYRLFNNVLAPEVRLRKMSHFREIYKRLPQLHH